MFSKQYEKADRILTAKLTDEEWEIVKKSLRFGGMVATWAGMLAGASMTLLVVWVLFKLGMI